MVMWIIVPKGCHRVSEAERTCANSELQTRCVTVRTVLAVRLVTAIAGVSLVVWTLGTAIKTVVVPRAYPSYLTRVHFVALRKVFNLFA